jgi:uncharacterized protein (DUF1501 family)
MALNRRKLLQLAGASAFTAASVPWASRMFTAHAADTSGYKALVCVFLFGGLDGHDLLLPYDEPSFAQFSRVRGSLLNTYGAARSRENLLPVNPDDASRFGSRQFALPPEFPKLKALFDQGRVSVVSNVGPLIEPTTASGFVSGSARVPSRLFSHNDQQSTWQSSAPEGAQLGWGGLFADAALASGANATDPAFTTLAATGVGPFLTGRRASPYQLSLSGSTGLKALAPLAQRPDSDLFAPFVTSAERFVQASSFSSDNVLERDMARLFRDGIATNNAFTAAKDSAIALSTSFPGSPLGSQLRAVAETISIRNSLFASRQIFFVGTGGFDTHSSQAADLPGLLTQIDDALAAFNAAMTELGVSQSVTTFTASDFGRTLAVNGDGTDHGWGGHHIVMGGAVRGRHIFGDVTPAELGHDLDAGGGRLIPSLSVEQLAGPLGRWWGLTESEVAAALPNLGNFDPANLDLFL